MAAEGRNDEQRTQPAGDPPEQTDLREPSGPTDPLVIFNVGAISIALHADLVEAITLSTEPMPLPLAPHHVPGVINLRGRVVPLLDLVAFLGLATQAEPGAAVLSADSTDLFRRIVVTSVDGMYVGILCEKVFRIAEVPRHLLRKPTTVQGQRLGEFATAECEYNGRFMLLVDLPRILEAAKVKA